MTKESSKYPSTFYRVSIKAVIHNDNGEVLLTKENDWAWSFPGGGIEHGESEIEALKRELKEEVLADIDFDATLIGIEPVYVDWLDTWVMWIMYEVKLPQGFTFGNGEGVEDTAFMRPEEFKDSENIWEQLVYKWGNKISAS